MFERFCRASGSATTRSSDRHQRDPRRRQPRAIHRRGARPRRTRDRGPVGRGRGALRICRCGQHDDGHQRRRARDRRRQHAADPRRRPAGAGARARSRSARCALTEQLLPDGEPGQEEGSRAGPRPRARDACRRLTGWAVGAPARRSRRRGPQPRGRRRARATGQIDIGIQGFVITAANARRPGAAAGRAARRRARRDPGDQARPRRHHPRRRARARDRRRTGRLRGNRGDRGGTARRPVPRRGRCSPAAEPLFDDVRKAAVRNLAVQYESDLHHVEQSRSWRCRCSTRSSPEGCLSPRPGERELLWAARCSTTSA